MENVEDCFLRARLLVMYIFVEGEIFYQTLNPQKEWMKTILRIKLDFFKISAASLSSG